MESKPHILLVDDEKIVLTALENQLKDLSYHVTSVPNGQEALNEIENTSFDAVLVDRMMSGIDGMALLTHIKRTPKLHLTPVIMMTGEAENEARIEAIRAGVFDFIFKPVEPELLAAVLRRALSH